MPLAPRDKSYARGVAGWTFGVARRRTDEDEALPEEEEEQALAAASQNKRLRTEKSLARPGH